MDEMARAHVLQLSKNKAKNRKISRRAKYIVKCKHTNCNIVSHAAIPEQAKVSSIPCFEGMACFEIAHHPRCKDLFSNIMRSGKMYCRTVPSHAVVQEVKELYKADLPRRSGRTNTNVMSRPVGRPPVNIQINERQQDEIESLTAVEGIETPAATPLATPESTPLLTRLRTKATKPNKKGSTTKSPPKQRVPRPKSKPYTRKSTRQRQSLQMQSV